ncbi:hypothetical protein ACHAW6_015867 [Cyclotella cf. meneghiniana]
MQGHPEFPCHWEKHIDKILRIFLGFVPMVHEPCIYRGETNGKLVLFRWQVDDFLLGAKSAATTNKGLISMYNGMDILQLRWFVKVSIKTWLGIMMEPYFNDWLNIPSTPMPTPLGSSEPVIKQLYSTEGDLVHWSSLDWRNRWVSRTKKTLGK